MRYKIFFRCDNCHAELLARREVSFLSNPLDEDGGECPECGGEVTPESFHEDLEEDDD